MAEDDERFRDYLCRILSTVGYRPFGVSSGRGALKLLLSADALITDLYMPDMDGVELLIRAGELTPGLPVICLSGGGYREAGDLLDDTLALGAAAAFRKPVDPQLLLGALKEALEIRGGAGGTRGE